MFVEKRRRKREKADAAPAEKTENIRRIGRIWNFVLQEGLRKYNPYYTGGLHTLTFQEKVLTLQQKYGMMTPV
ncbi:hypothetical protein KQI82_07110 [Oscillibacter sp. MSJ-2]|uniref:Uncharacterized protein n=1 Tax=Dysosmobacter acutus TaxID=2841504 RepID=A0ABS6F8R5_9FIRM|nr:hypothetical protein [Dysosmobacter acutus]MBU5626684.1 hypothetical protein [Dysosmobacter acutus]